MNRKIIFIFNISVLACLLLISLSLPIAMAASGEKGVNVIKQGKHYYQGRTIIREEIVNNSGDLVLVDNYNALYELKVDILDVDECFEQIIYQSSDHAGTITKVITNATNLDIFIFYRDSDNDNLLEMFYIDNSFFDFKHVIAGTWDDFVAPLDNLSRNLEWAKGNVSSFNYALDIDETSQTISLRISYLDEDYFWYDNGVDIYKESIIYNNIYEYTIEYDDFVINNYEELIQRSINTIVNQSYLEENKIQYDYNHTIQADFSPITLNGTISGFELFALLGTSIVSILGITYILKHKKIKN